MRCSQGMIKFSKVGLHLPGTLGCEGFQGGDRGTLCCLVMEIEVNVLTSESNT